MGFTNFGIQVNVLELGKPQVENLLIRATTKSIPTPTPVCLFKRQLIIFSFSAHWTHLGGHLTLKSSPIPSLFPMVPYLRSSPSHPLTASLKWASVYLLAFIGKDGCWCFESYLIPFNFTETSSRCQVFKSLLQSQKNDDESFIFLLFSSLLSLSQCSHMKESWRKNSIRWIFKDTIFLQLYGW